MAFIFTMRSTGSSGSMHRRDPASGSSLPAISEDSASFLEPRAPPAIPERALNRPSTRIWALGAPPIHAYDSPPPYNRFDDVFGPNGEKLSDVRRQKGIRDKKWFAKRGGWKRLALIALVVILCIVALGVGLGVGLTRKHSSSSSKDNGSSSSSSQGGASGTPNNPATNNPASNTTFPAGSYRFETFLDTVATNCSSNPNTWLCYPYSTYAENPSSSAATFEWIISPVNNTNNFTISSTQNYFSIVFSNLSLILQKEGASDEHYFFQTMMQKPTKPSVQLGSSNVASTCYFNSTTFQGYLYTKMPKSYPNNSTNTTTEAFTPWPYAVKVEQVAAAGVGTPTCLGPSGESLGDFSVEDGTQLCDCLYLNTGT
ncbi:uncharacterized protein PAC_04926 [Phialocephala subalpina]|uniref:Tat pathway signal sequence n=1 Tax=Phialocephala subalpina TaxID=576137 RepID=A0A1L7WQJ2_9HELO|nr:uncharacterized protein PAC_04926 [Phialocephala subalpina]